MIFNIFNRRKKIDEEFFEELEETLILADTGFNTTNEIMDELRSIAKKEKIDDSDELKKALKNILIDLVSIENESPVFPMVMLITGVNGVGKTTAIGKIANIFNKQGKTVLLAAADTFRAAAGEQLEIWANRANVSIIKYSKDGADPSAVIYDAMDSAKAKKTDVVICDTAGRLHNKKNLMSELEKINRVIDKSYPAAKKQTYIVLDATTGQNALMQAKTFSEILDLNGIILTKLDGTAKGGIVISIINELKIPICYIGVGEGIDDLKQFNASEFVDNLFE